MKRATQSQQLILVIATAFLVLFLSEKKTVK